MSIQKPYACGVCSRTFTKNGFQHHQVNTGHVGLFSVEERLRECTRLEIELRELQRRYDLLQEEYAKALCPDLF